MTREHEGRVAVVTGAASGIGRSSVERLVAGGGSVVAVDLAKDALEWASEADGVEPIVADVTSADDNAAAIEAAITKFGQLDALVLNAGVAAMGSLEELDLDAFERSLDVNVRGVVLGVRAGVAALKRSASASIVVTASVSGLAGDPGMWAYNTAKGAVVNFVRSAALDLGRYGIRVNAVCPGPTRTGMTSFIEEAAPEAYEAMRRRIPLQRWGESSEVAEVIAFLASPAASFVTGALIPVDGGVSANTSQFEPAPRAED